MNSLQPLSAYLLMISYGQSDKVTNLLKNFKHTLKPENFSKFIILENSPKQRLNLSNDFSNKTDIYYKYIKDSNKASLINYGINKIIPEEEALIILIDNDISFQKSFLINYYKAAIQNGPQYFYGGSLKVHIPRDIDEKIIPYLSISATGKSDEAFLNQKELMFLGCNYCIFKSQWKYVNGFDERFSAGSKYGLGADESVFQKKLKHVGFKPYFIKNNEVVHHIEKKLYLKKNVLARIKNNGYTHGFQDLITSQKIVKKNYFKNLFFLFKRFLILFFFGKFMKAHFKFNYFLGYLKAYFLYLKINDKKSFLDGLIKDSVKN